MSTENLVEFHAITRVLQRLLDGARFAEDNEERRVYARLIVAAAEQMADAASDGVRDPQGGRHEW